MNQKKKKDNGQTVLKDASTALLVSVVAIGGPVVCGPIDQLMNVLLDGVVVQIKHEPGLHVSNHTR